MNEPKSDILQEYQRNWHQEKKRVRIDWALNELGGTCKHCGSTDTFLEFDHIDPATKEFKISSGISVSWKRFVAEVAKCQLLCTECHKKKTKDNDETLYRHRVFCHRGHQYTPENTKWTKDRNNRDRRECRACLKIVSQEYYKAQPEKWLEYYHENRDKIRAQRKVRYEANKEEINQQQAEFREKNREHIREGDRRRYAAKKAKKALEQQSQEE